MSRLPVLLLSLVASQLPAAGPAILNPTARQALSLDGEWHVIVDPYDVGYYDYRGETLTKGRQAAGGFFLDRKAAGKSDLVEYNFDTSPVLAVPRDWNSQDPKLFYYEGSVWYRKTFDFRKRDPADRVFVYFGGANYQADVCLNGIMLGRHVGGFTPFQFEITDLVRPTGNSLVVRVNDQRTRAGVPALNTDWWNYGGLTRDVMILETPPTFVCDYFLQLKPGAPGVVSGYVQLDGPAPAAVQVSIPELHVEAAFQPDAGGRAAVEFPLTGATLWTPENPRRYEVVVSAGADRVGERIGFRTIEVRGQDILLNGRPVFLRGVALHEENPLRGGRACTPEDDRLLLGWAKELGCNYVRLAHYPHNEFMARTADELGLLLWEEVPVYWNIQWENPDTLANAQAQLTELIERDKNRASVIIWSMANETPVSPARLAFLGKQVALARRLDPTRLISAAMEVHVDPTDPHTRISDDPFAELVDVLGFNEYVGWYVGLPDDCPLTRFEIKSTKPVIVSEFGAGALQGFHADRLTRFSEEFQEDVYRQTLPMLGKIPQLRGMTPWILCDFRSPRRPLPGIQDGWNRKGLIGSNGRKKLAYHVLQEFYAEKAAAAAKP